MAIGSLIERYYQRESPIHRADARLKLPTAFGCIVAITLTREGDWTVLALLTPPLAGAILASRLPLALVLRRSLLALPFIAVAVPLLFTRGGEELFTLPLLGWDVTREGIVVVMTIVAKSWLSVVVAVLLTATTPVPELLRALRVLRVPRVLVATVGFAYRYLFVVAQEAGQILRARTSRSAALPGHRAGGSLRWRASVAGHLAGSLFVRSLNRSERIYVAMQARGYDGEPRLLAPPRLRPRWIVGGALLPLYGLAVQLVVRL